jgi:lipopolysaccharide transport protein LptA
MVPSFTKVSIQSLLAIFLLIGCGLAIAEELGSDPIHIEADRMESDPQKESVIFSGSVEAIQGEVTINADTMEVNYFPADTQGAERAEDEKITQKVKNIVAQGNVKIIKKDLIATGNTMTYFSAEQEIRLSGNAKAWQDQNQVSGENIYLYLNEGRSVVEGSSTDGQRVKAYIYTGGSLDSETVPAKPE